MRFIINNNEGNNELRGDGMVCMVTMGGRKMKKVREHEEEGC